MSYKNIEEFLEKYRGNIGLTTLIKYDLFFISIFYRDEQGIRLIAEVGYPTLEEAMFELDKQIGQELIY